MVQGELRAHEMRLMGFFFSFHEPLCRGLPALPGLRRNEGYVWRLCVHEMSP